MLFGCILSLCRIYQKSRSDFMFYEQIRKLCFDRGMSMREFAISMGLGQNTPTRWKQGTIPRSDTLQRIADYFGVSVDFLLNGEAQPASNSIGDVSGSSIVQGVHGGYVAVSNGGGQTDLTAAEAELLRIFRSLDVRGQNAVMSCLYEQEDRINQK